MRFGLLLFILISAISMNAQNNQVKGNVVDNHGEPVIGATIVEANNSKNATLTDGNGNFTINLSKQKSKLVATYIGFKQTETTVSAGNPVKVIMQEDEYILDEIVSVGIGYGTARRRDLTGAISSVDEKTLRHIPTTSTASAITGRMAGVHVVTTQGSPDAEVNITVRGGGSISQSNEPLYIVDGFKVSSLDEIPPSDIESIDVLKDAASTAIYGAEGANGVILVTTKKGHEGKPEITLTASVGFNKMYRPTEVLSPYEFVYLQRELDPSDNASFFSRYGLWEDIDIYKSKKGLDWQNKIFGNTGVKQNYGVNINGGTKDLTYSISYVRDDEDYILKSSNYTRDNLNAKLRARLMNNLLLDFNVKMTNRVINGPSISSGRKLRDAVKYMPVKTLSDISDEDLAGESEYELEQISNLNDPVFNIENEYKKQEKFSNSYILGLTWDILKGLSLRAEGTYGYMFNRTNNIWLKNTSTTKSLGGQPVAKRETWKGNNWTLRSTLNYKLNINRLHRIDLMAGFEALNSEQDLMTVNSDYYPSDYTVSDILSMWNNGTSEPTYTTISEPKRTVSYFGRANYVFADKYFATFTLRADGTNVFSPGNKWGVFPAVAIAWRLSEEPFMETTREWLNNLKLRVSYGKAGNARVNSYWRQTYEPITSVKYLYYQNEIGQSGLQPSTILRNENLTWESKYSFNTGLDINLFNNRLIFNVDFYNDVTKNLILQVPLPSNSGYNYQYQNKGQTTNRGLEITLNARIINSKDFWLNGNFNISFNKNKVDKLYDGEQSFIPRSTVTGIDVGSDAYRVNVGDEVGLMYGYVYDGMYDFDDFVYNPTTKRWDLRTDTEDYVDCSGVLSRSGNYYGPGHIKLKDLNGDHVIDAENDRQVIGHAQPKHTGGFGFELGWKGFDLTALFNWSYGNDVFNINKIDYTSYAGSKKYENMSTLLEGRFRTIDPATGRNIYYGDYADPQLLQQINANATMWSPLMNNSIITSWAVEDGSFLRLGTLSLGYTLPKKILRSIGSKNLRIYATAYNLFCLTGYSGQDPEVNTGDIMTPGQDSSAYPKSRSFIFGLSVTF